MSESFRDRRVVVVGAGVAGAAAAQVLVEGGAEVVVSETLPADGLPQLERLREMGVAVAVGGHDPSHLDGATLLVTSPGVPQDAPILSWAYPTPQQLPPWVMLRNRACVTT